MGGGVGTFFCTVVFCLRNLEKPGQGLGFMRLLLQVV